MWVWHHYFLFGQTSDIVSEEMKELMDKVATLQQDKWRLEERVSVYCVGACVGMGACVLCRYVYCVGMGACVLCGYGCTLDMGMCVWMCEYVCASCIQNSSPNVVVYHQVCIRNH